MVRSYCIQFMAACWLALLSTLVLAQAPSSEGLTAFVDRTDISLNDLVTLTIRVDAALGNNRPSFAGLNQSFEQVGGMSTRSTYTNNNGAIQSWTEYNITLRPLQLGELTIPAFRVGGESTNPITLRVSEAAPTAANASDEIFLRSSISKDSLYVQEQLIYAIRIYYSIGFDQGAQLSSPQVDNAVVQQLGSDQNFQEVVNGIGYNVTERRFVIYPQSSGELNIPPVQFSASIGRRGGINRLFNNRATVREVNLSSDDHRIEVKPRPASFPGATWLPAAALSLEENWSGALDTVKVGDAITRNVKLTVSGLSSSLLPGIPYEDLPGLRFYPDQPVREDVANANGVVGTRSEGTAMVASRPGSYELPEVRLPWWNTVTDTLEVATLPARTISVLPASEAETDLSAVPPLLPDSEVPQAGRSSSASGAQDTISNPAWMFATGLFALAWLFTLFLWLGQRRHLAYARSMAVPMRPNLRPGAASHNAVTSRSGDADGALKVLKQACQKGQPADIRKALIQWARRLFKDRDILSLTALADHCGDETFSAHLRTLDASLYGEQTATAQLDTKGLYGCAAELHKHGVRGADKERYALPPLYKH